MTDSPRTSRWSRLDWRAERWFLASLGALSLFGLFVRLQGLSRGSFYRDDAWVALTRRVPWSVAWHMVGTAPGFVLFEKIWVGLTAPSTWWAQMPTLVVSVVGIVAVGLLARYWGLSRQASVFAAALIAVSRIDVQYATHLKPYASDVIATVALLATAEFFRRGHSLWPFAVACLSGVAVSFSVAPVALGAAVLVGVRAARQHRWRELARPAVVIAVPLGLLYFAVRDGISARLRRSWSPNFVSWHSLHAVISSSQHIVSGVIWGFIDTTLQWHLAGFSKLTILFVIVATLAGLWHNRSNGLLVAALAVAGACAAFHVAPLGTGRTDAYLYPVLAVLVASGVECVVHFIAQRQQNLARVATALVLVFVGIIALNLAVHRPSYPGGSIDPVAADASRVVSAGGGVLIEGSARWPWTYYETRSVRIEYSNLYNTGFAPLSSTAHVVVMRGTDIEGGYNAVGAVTRVAAFHIVLFVRTDDWPSLGNPEARAFADHHFVAIKQVHVPGYVLIWYERTDSLQKRVPLHIVQTTKTS